MSAENMPTVLSRLLHYVSFNTQSSRESETAPSTPSQLVLAKDLAEELRRIGVQNVSTGDGGTVYASIPATAGCEENPAIGFIAHMDTSPDAPGENVKPQIVRYEGGDVVLNKDLNIVFREKDFPEISKYAGEDVVFTDGTTLLGADDKAGVAAVMDMADHIMRHPEIPHAKICISFTPDEEIARGTENFDIPRFGAAYAYTLDGDERGVLESENFNGATAMVTVKGVGVHPGLAKNKMVNSLRYAAKFIEMLPSGMAPESTEGREGFLHPNFASGSVVETKIRVLIRDHDRAKYEEKKELLRKLVARMNELHPEAETSVTIRDSYENMRPYLEKAPKVLGIVREAYRACGLQPLERPIRGGTDGARLSVRGLPCPNVFTGGMNFHGIYECIPVKSLELARDVAVELARRSSEVKSLV